VFKTPDIKYCNIYWN